MNKKQLYLWLLVSILLGVACDKNTLPKEPGGEAYTLVLPPGFPMPDIPAENQLTVARVELGKQLFHDKALSRDYSLSCASCHIQSKAFADTNPVSVGFQGKIGKRNVPTLANVAYHPYFFAEGGNPSLERQVLGPIDEGAEMGFNSAELAERLPTLTHYNKLAQEAYGRDLDLFVLTRSIASFERTLISGNSPYDAYTYQNQTGALSEQQLKGKELFFSERMGCSTCHSGFNFTDYSFQNNGLYKVYADRARARITQKVEDEGKFKVPSLRNIALTAPYMHDGSLVDLEVVIQHYSTGGKSHPNQHPLIRTLDISQSEQSALISFLHSLTDTTFVQ